MTDRTDVIEGITERAEDLAEDYTRDLSEFVDKLVPKTLANAEYAARCSALMIALNRNLARCAAAFGEVHEIKPEEMVQLVAGQFSRYHVMCLNALRGEGSTTQ